MDERTDERGGGHWQALRVERDKFEGRMEGVKRNERGETEMNGRVK